MNLSSGLLEAAVKEFSKLPGIGKKTALRLVLHLLKQEKEDVQLFSDTIERMRREIKFCSNCFNISDGDLCAICLNPGRKKEVICVVENIRDVIAIESTEQYHGSYHVLGGVISPTRGNQRDCFCVESYHPGRYHHLLRSQKTQHTGIEIHNHCQGYFIWW
jgi:recombination protein RecR